MFAASVDNGALLVAEVEELAGVLGGVAGVVLGGGGLPAGAVEVCSGNVPVDVGR